MKPFRLFFTNRRNLTFVICLLLSVFIWSLKKLSKNLIRELSVPVTVINLPADKVFLPSAPNYVRITVEGNGTLDGMSYTLTAEGNSANGVTWKTTCGTTNADIFPAGFCSK